MALNPLSARDRQAGIPGLITRERVATLQGFLTTPHVVRGAQEVYEIGATHSVTLATGPLFLSGVRFRFTANRAWNIPAGIIIPEGCFVDVLNIECTTACTTLQNMVRLMGNCSVGEIRLVAPQQQANMANYDVSAVNVVGQNAHIGHMQCEAVDKVLSFGGRVWREDLPTPALFSGGADYCTLGSLNVLGYQKALQIKGCKGVSVDSVFAKGRSEFAEVRPGRNVVQIGDGEDITVNSVIGHNSTEHGIYVSGGSLDTDTEIARASTVTFGTVDLLDCGQCGFKAKANYREGNAGQNLEHRGIKISSLTVRGCNAMGGTIDPATDNADGIRIENVQYLNIGSALVEASGVVGSVSCKYGLHIDGVNRAVIGPTRISGTSQAALYVRDFRGNNADLWMPSLLVYDAKSHAVLFRHTSKNVRRIHIRGRADTVAGDLIRIEGPGTEAPSGSESFIEMDYTKVTGSPLVRTGDPDIKVKTTNMNSTFT